MTINIIVISPNASRTGAPILLLNLISYLKNNGCNVSIVFKNGGSLLNDYEKIGQVFKLQKYNCDGHIFKRKFFGLLNRLYSKYTINKIKKKKYDLIYSNTATVGTIALSLLKKNVKLITHVHELQNQLNGCIDTDELLNASDKVIAVSKEVSRNLKDTYNILDKKIDVIYGAPKLYLNSLKAKQVSNTTFTVGGSGLADLRKGIDLFIQLCKITNNKAKSPIQFVWVGNNSEPYYNQMYKHYWSDIKKLNIENEFIMTGQVDNPEVYFQSLDVFCLTSREDPFPLVCLEAASLGKPVICFNKGTGIKEFVDDDSGYIVPYMDLNAMAEKIIYLSDNPDICEQIGKQAQKKIKTQFSFAKMAEEVSNTICSLR